MDKIKPKNLVEQKKAVEYFKVHNSIFLKYLRDNKINVLKGNFIEAESLEGFNDWHDKRKEDRKKQMEEVGRRVGILRKKQRNEEK